jgi:LAO/AO transport system kinase
MVNINSYRLDKQIYNFVEMANTFNKKYTYHPKNKPDLSELVKGISSGDKTILSQAITLLESNNEDDRELIYQLIKKLPSPSQSTIRIGITGSPGVGKSTFIESFGSILCKKNYKVAVLAIDPSSEKTGGSILGDKTRMESLSTMKNAFIRPTPSKGQLGGVAQQSHEAILLCEMAGFEVILVETVGVGQSETHVKELVDFFLLLMLSGAGDELQGIKRGIMELADTILITKSDEGNELNAKKAKLNYQNALHLFPQNENKWTPQVLTCSSLTNTGIDEVWKLIEKFEEYCSNNGWIKENRSNQNKFWFHQTLQNFIKNKFYSSPSVKNKLEELEKLVSLGGIDPINAAKELFNLL